MGPACALWVLLALLDALAGVGSQPTGLPTAVRMKQDFDVDKFQGEWFVLGLAGSTHSKADRHLLSPFTATFTKNSRQQLEVTYAMVRSQRCVIWSYVLTPATELGKFSVENRGELGTDTEDVWVHETNYTTFALMSSHRQSVRQIIVRVHLLFRLWAIQTKTLEKFLCLLQALGLSEANIVFPDFPDWAPYRTAC